MHDGTELAQRLRRYRPVMPYALERLRVYALIGQPVIRNILCLHPVSYTHLDVYKRQLPH